MEITQFTYFQQAGGMTLEPVSVELTYGLERIAMYLQGVREVWQISWDGRRTYGDVYLQQEIEHCKYNFEIADVERLKQMYNLYEAEAQSALRHHLVIPAHDYVLRCSQTFNLLDARGAIGVTERASYFGRMRDLARQVSDLFAEQRMRMEYPFLDEEEARERTETRESRANGGNRSRRSPRQICCWRSAVKSCRWATWCRASISLAGWRAQALAEARLQLQRAARHRHAAAAGLACPAARWHADRRRAGLPRAAGQPRLRRGRPANPCRDRVCA